MKMKKKEDTDCWYQEWKKEHTRRPKDIKGLINEMSKKIRCQ